MAGLPRAPGLAAATTSGGRRACRGLDAATTAPALRPSLPGVKKIQHFQKKHCNIFQNVDKKIVSETNIS
jgi:hypothetical protein